MLHDVVVVRTRPWWLSWPWEKQFMGSYQYGALLWVTRALLRVEIHFHRDQSRLSFWLSTVACSQSKQQYLWGMLSWHQIWTYLQDTYIHAVRISQLCVTTGSVSKCMLFIFRARGEDRWHSRTAEQNHGGVETGAIYGEGDTSQVNNKYI